MRSEKRGEPDAQLSEAVPAGTPEKTYFPRQADRPLENPAQSEPPAERPTRETLTRGQKLIVFIGSVIAVLLAVLIVLVIRMTPGKNADRVVVMGDNFEELYVETAGSIDDPAAIAGGSPTTIRRIVTTYPAGQTIRAAKTTKAKAAKTTKAKVEKTTKEKAAKTTKPLTERAATTRVIPTTVPATTEPAVERDEVERAMREDEGVGQDYIGQDPDEGVGYEEIGQDKININTASAEELKSLDRIGDAKADAIIAYREQVGPFRAIEEIMDVPGIGEGIFGAIWYMITV